VLTKYCVIIFSSLILEVDDILLLFVSIVNVITLMSNILIDTHSKVTCVV